MPKKPAKKVVDTKSNIIHLLSCCNAILLLLLVSFNINIYLNSQKVLGTQTEVKIDNTLIEQKSFWEKIVSQNPTYRDGFLSLAQIEFELGNNENAQIALQKAKQIDPNSPKVLEIEKSLKL